MLAVLTCPSQANHKERGQTKNKRTEAVEFLILNMLGGTDKVMNGCWVSIPKLSTSCALQ